MPLCLQHSKTKIKCHMIFLADKIKIKIFVALHLHKIDKAHISKILAWSMMFFWYGENIYKVIKFMIYNLIIYHELDEDNW